ncbi:hypothetical protein [Caballeronia sp. INSB1]|uniref:hypothetical protein n=1 Tax=Caballeronia sp. INSB1 TaxID=2921751 RepID=UPI0020331B78|nr:hypothetical protein [Caballeronia sp. INSB1]
MLDKSKLLDTALRTFDLSCVRNANDYEIAVLNCIGASVHTDDGLKELAKLIEAEPKLSPLWRALGGGDDPLMDRLSRYLTVARAVFTVADSYVDARAATAATNILASLVQHYVVTAPTEMAKVQVLRLRHVSERRFNVTLGYTEVTLEQFARYAVEMEGYRALGPDVFARWHLEITQGPGSLPGTMQTKGSAHIEVWEWETIGAATVQTAAHASSRPIPATGNPLLRNAKRLRDMVTVKADSVRGPAGVLFTGIGGVLAAWTMRGAVKDVRGGANPTTVAAIIGASFGVIGSGIEITTLGLSIYIKRQGNAALAKTIATLGFKWGTTYAGTAAAAIMAVADSVRAANAYNDSNPEQAKFYLYSALAGSAVALATFAGGSATLATMAAGGGGAVAVLGLTPVGWFVIAVAATAAVVYFSWKAINAQHDPTDVWLKHSAWGVHTKHYTLDEELKAWHSLHFRPRLSATWESDSGKLGTLRLRVTLPSSDSVDDLRTDIKVTLRGTALKPVSPGLQGNYIDIDHQYAVRPIFDNSYSVERGYYISMHEDARVEFSYLYRPFLLTAPDIGLEQQGTPKPLVFTSGGWFSDPIDPSKIAVVEDPQ